MPTAPRFEHHELALGIAERAPRISWTTTAPDHWRQAAYELELRRGDDITRWEVESDESVLVPWPAAPLTSRERIAVRVRVRGQDGIQSEWSDPASAEAGLDAADWVASPVGGAWVDDGNLDLRRPALVRRGFDVPDAVVSARLYVTAHGLYSVEINGQRIGIDELNPGWTDYGSRLRYHTYDVTDQVQPGANAIGAWLADGWYRGRLGFDGGHHNLYGDDQAVMAQVEIETASGEIVVIATDESWRAHPSPILSSGLLDGETYDARLELPGWSTSDYDDAGWSTVRKSSRDARTLVAPEGPAVRCTEVRPVQHVTTSPSGRTILDFGQNFAGRLRIRVSGAAGTRIRLRHAEVLQDGELYTRTLRGALSVDSYILRGEGEEVWEPKFTIHGFRYAEVEGWPGDLKDVATAQQVVAVVLHSDLRRTGWFESSSAELNRLHENVLWSMRSNFVDIPTDCPQRDERLGWTGDIQVFAPTASYLYDVSGFLSSWLKDVAAEQRTHGTVPWYVPVIPGGHQWTPVRPGAVWGDVAVLTPLVLYDRFGDIGILERQYHSASAWVEQVAALAGPSRLWNTSYQLGDWLDPSAPPDEPTKALTDPSLVATAYFAWSSASLARTARILGRDGDAQKYSQLADEVRAAFLAEYYRGAGVLTGGTQTAYALAICFNLIPQRDRAAAGAALADLVASGGYRVGTGFAGTNLVADALSLTGQLDAAFRLLLERSAPSWLHMVELGATTIWERWDSLLDDGTVNSGEMTSFNHYALGAIADWMHRTIGGLAPLEPGYRRVRVAPRWGHGITSAATSFLSAYGLISVAWRITGPEVTVELDIPVGVTAEVDLLRAETALVGPGSYIFTVPA